MATIAAQITEAEAELVLIKSQMASASAGGQSVSIDGVSVSRIDYKGLSAQRTTLEKRLQRLYRGGRGMLVDMTYGPGRSTQEAATSE